MIESEILLVARARHLAKSGEGARIRAAADLSLGEVATAIGVSVPALWRWEHGERSPRGERAAAWARLLSELQEAGAA